jgi:hypothetical protein
VNEQYLPMPILVLIVELIVVICRNLSSNELGGMGLCATGHFAPKQNYKVLKNNNVN